MTNGQLPSPTMTRDRPYRPRPTAPNRCLSQWPERSSLVLSGMAMTVAGTSRPCSGADHEIIHAIDSLYPQTAGHGELAGLGALFSYHLRDDDYMFDLIARRLAQHDLPRTPADLGLTDEQFVAAVREAPATRPDRYTILEHLDLEEAAIRDRVKGFVERLT